MIVMVSQDFTYKITPCGTTWCTLISAELQIFVHYQSGISRVESQMSVESRIVLIA